ncbi:hypothetical protein GF420_03765 [candidate division GN15 bacterium]|nr:hypothetical protein [candidate division GN15 bacterium]
MYTTTRNRPRFGLALLAALALMIVVACSDDNNGATDSGDTDVSISGSIPVPAAWAGTWEITFEMYTCSDSQLVLVDRLTDTLCETQTVDWPIAPIMSQCGGSISGDSLIIDCTDTVVLGDCTIAMQLQFEASRSGDALTGAGRFEATTTGSSCDTLDLIGMCDVVTMEGTRIGNDCP